MTNQPQVNLKHLTFKELFEPIGLEKLDALFLEQLKARDTSLHQRLLAYREQHAELTPIEISDLIIETAKILEIFLAELFSIEEALAISQIKTTDLNPISQFKKYFVLRRAKKELNRTTDMLSFAELSGWLEQALQDMPLKSSDKELAIALLGTHYLNAPEQYKEEIEKLVAWCTRALTTPEAQALTENWTSFKIPQRTLHQELVTTVAVECRTSPTKGGHEKSFRHRDGFKLTDPRMTAREVQDEVNYCIYCHDHDGDFCSKGFPVKKGDPSQGFKKNPLDLTLTGCPLEEKISEMNFLKRDGHTIASLAVVMIDNPLCPATGHRICNDCMKACIYQKQDPVNIPQIETRVLLDALNLPWGVEIYDLLTRWHPIRPKQWLLKPYNGLKVMIAGMGPAGFTLAHHLLLEGFAVVGFDGLKIEPLDSSLLSTPIYRYEDLKESLDERVMAGFGGVAEYGITVRWDKNFLKLIYLTLMRRKHFQVFGNVRFGGTVTIEDAWEMGFDHFVVAVGAGLPKALNIPQSLAPGMRQANDFLMALQLNSAAKKNSLTQLQVRLPAVVIGGGLTGVDTATEIQAYYLAQVEKIKLRFDILAKEYSKDTILTTLDEPSRNILQEFLRHADAIEKERQMAKTENRLPQFIKLLREWGGVTIAYRRTMQESPAYINNHEELQKALQEGIYYAENLEPRSVGLDEHGHVNALAFLDKAQGKEIDLPARAILVATGTQPNTAYEFEHKGTFNRIQLQYQHYDNVEGNLTTAHGVTHCKAEAFGPFTSYQQSDHRVTLIGDTHPVFHGNVVKAIASGMRTYPHILNLFKNRLKEKGDLNEYAQFAEKMRTIFTATVVSVTRQTEKVVELIIHAPLAAKHFQPGQFYRLQNFETEAPSIHHTKLQMEPLSLVAADCDKKNGTLTFYVTENSVSARLTTFLQPGEPISLMGPTGVRAKIPEAHETILMIGDESSIPFTRAYAQALKNAGNHVYYVAKFPNKNALYSQPILESLTDGIVWLTETGIPITTNRDNDLSVTGDNILSVLTQNKKIPLQDVDRIFVVGDVCLLKQIQEARATVLKDVFVKNPKVFGSVYGKMQCMLKGVCAQCLQWQIDPETGQRTKAVFTCSWQDEPLEIIDFSHLAARHEQNALHEKMGHLWLDYLFSLS